jgi:hypothetical protein
MCRVTVTDEEGMYKTCLIEKETPRGLLNHFRINPDTKNVYMNGKMLTKEELSVFIPENRPVHIAIESKATLRVNARF